LYFDTVDTATHTILGNTKTKMEHVKSRNWVLVLNNYTEEELTHIHNEFEKKSKRFIIGKEIAPTTGTPHLQMFVSYNNARSMSGMKKINGRMKIIKAKGDEYQNKVYCSKDNIYASKNIMNVLSKEEKKKNKDIWLYHLDKHRTRGTQCGLYWILNTIDLLERNEIEDELIERYEYYTDVRDDMIKCEYCLEELKKDLQDE